MEAKIVGFKTGEKNGIRYVIMYFTYKSSFVTGLCAGSTLVSAAYADKLKLAARVCVGWDKVKGRNFLYIPKEAK